MVNNMYVHPDSDEELPAEVLEALGSICKTTEKFVRVAAQFAAAAPGVHSSECTLGLPTIEEYNDTYILTIAVAHEVVLKKGEQT